MGKGLSSERLKLRNRMVELISMSDPRLQNERIAEKGEVIKLSKCVLWLDLMEGEEQG